MQLYSNVITAILISFLIVLALGPIVIPILKKIKAGQSIRDDGPITHLEKEGTPTMGGIMIVASVVFTSIFVSKMSPSILIMVISILAFSGIGFIDDFIKVVLKRNLGLRAYQKLSLQIIAATGIAIYQSKIAAYTTIVYIPILKIEYDLGLFYIPFVVFVVIAMVNSVNLTDGLDGLASGVTFFIAIFLAITAVSFGYKSVSVFSGALIGACAGFLIFNVKPAKVFMGDTGSLGLGGAIAAASVLMNMTLLLPIVGAIFVVEALSVVLQVGSYKIRKKRIFKMAPIHHHFELSGWSEKKVVYIFWAITAALCALGLFVIL